ncbi:unnamed protein product [Soboliphyme baturini]|uniref:CAAX prenyl protease 2 n=1 Tax=Soboliphyme baturini TaxID=241478 RepID=A0A183IG56_9BILA|nr:unnamed protein product [Soboliphyme baturini]
MTTISCCKSFVSATLVPLVYIACIRVCSWGCFIRDDKKTIWRRFFGACVACLILGYSASYWKNENLTYAQFFGFRASGLLPALVLPLQLTAFLYLGPIVLSIVDGCWRLDWESLRPDCITLRNLVLVSDLTLHDVDRPIGWSAGKCTRSYSFQAPLTEEFAFRCCILPMLQNCLSAKTSLFIVPLFFSMGHFHHVIEQRRLGYSWKTSINICAFQAFYTYIFGLYASFLYLRTDHFVAAVLCHSFCNRMGLPECDTVYGLQRSKRCLVCFSYLFGFLIWLFLFIPTTEPRIYQNFFAPDLF